MLQVDVQSTQVDRQWIVEALKDIQGRNNMACLWGMTPSKMLIRQHLSEWIISRQNHGQKLITQQAEIERARMIFTAWDSEDKGYLTVQELTDQFLSLGLSTDVKFVQRFLESLSHKKLEILTLKKFLKVFEYDKFGDHAFKLIT